ncbi:MAG: hypothetical protein LUM44_15230 [Pyrinomonadaceae bacterium]|nr:hypothetical protein [Pyrinomonadaceae bacterium]
MKIKVCFAFLSALFLNFTISAQAQCGDLPSMPSILSETPISGRDPKAVALAKNVSALMKKAVSGAKGGQIKLAPFTSGIVPVPNSKIQSFTIAMRFLHFECVGGKPKPSAATDTWMYVGVNEIPFFTENFSASKGEKPEESFKLPNGNQMFLNRYKLDGDFNGFQQIKKLPEESVVEVLLSKAGKLPFRNVSQAEFLNVYKAYFVSKKSEYLNRLEAVLAKEPADIARMRNDAQMEGREASIKALIESNNNARKTVAQIKNELASCNQRIDSYIETSNSNQPAIIEVIDEYCKPAEIFVKADNPNSANVVVFDESFFNKTLPPPSPQFIVVHWRRRDAFATDRNGAIRFPQKRDFIFQFEKNFDLAALNKLLEN